MNVQIENMKRAAQNAQASKLAVEKSISDFLDEHEATYLELAAELRTKLRTEISGCELLLKQLPDEEIWQGANTRKLLNAHLIRLQNWDHATGVNVEVITNNPRILKTKKEDKK